MLQIGIQVYYVIILGNLSLIVVTTAAFSVLSLIMIILPLLLQWCHFKPSVTIEGFITLESHNLRQKHAFAHSKVRQSLMNTFKQKIKAKYDIEVYHFDNTIKESGRMTVYFNIYVAGAKDEETMTDIMGGFQQVMESLGSSAHDVHQKLIKVCYLFIYFIYLINFLNYCVCVIRK